jgi:transposase
MEAALVTQLNILRLQEMKPNYSELARYYGIDRRTVKKYYNGYEGKPKTRNKVSMLDQHYDTIRTKLQIRGASVKAVYEYLIDQGFDIGGYSNFNKYIKAKGLKPKKTPKGHPRFETLPGVQAQADWKEDIKLTSRSGVVYTFNVFNYKLGNSRYCHFTYKTYRTRQDVFDCLIAAFTSEGGIPKEILFDNMSSVVDLNGNRRSINPKMKAFADDFGFKIRLCKPRHSFTKGKVEVSNNILLVGTSGVGKTHLATAIGMESAKNRFSTYFISFHSLMSQLKKALDENRLESRMKFFARYKVLIIDEIGYLPIDPDAANLFFQLIARRYDKHCTIITTNSPFSKWGEIFGSPTLANAILDRLLHHSHVISIKGPSYRLRENSMYWKELWTTDLSKNCTFLYSTFYTFLY